MTLHVSRKENETKADVVMTYGPIQAKCTEDVSGLRALWSSLGRVLEEIDNETKGE